MMCKALVKRVTMSFNLVRPDLLPVKIYGVALLTHPPVWETRCYALDKVESNRTPLTLPRQPLAILVVTVPSLVLKVALVVSVVGTPFLKHPPTTVTASPSKPFRLPVKLQPTWPMQLLGAKTLLSLKAILCTRQQCKVLNLKCLINTLGHIMPFPDPDTPFLPTKSYLRLKTPPGSGRLSVTSTTG